MEWQKPLIILRVNASGKLEPVYVPEDIKKAKYWLTYIAQTGDVLCKTPLHNKHSRTSEAVEYYSHKEQSGKVASNEEQWKGVATQMGWDSVFPVNHTDQVSAT